MLLGISARRQEVCLETCLTPWNFQFHQLLFTQFHKEIQHGVVFTSWEYSNGSCVELAFWKAKVHATFEGYGVLVQHSILQLITV